MDLTQSFEYIVPTASKYLSKGDIGEDGLIVTINTFEMEVLESDSGSEDKLVCYFNELEKGLVVNRTNAQLIGIATGAKTPKDSIGKQVVVYVDPSINFGGKVIGGIRIKKIAGQPRAPQPTNKPLANDPMADLNDDIPF